PGSSRCRSPALLHPLQAVNMR
ncbi:hypothetical protein HaLaN_31664, partial [Haematococcus lacustris]